MRSKDLSKRTAYNNISFSMAKLKSPIIFHLTSFIAQITADGGERPIAGRQLDIFIYDISVCNFCGLKSLLNLLQLCC